MADEDVPSPIDFHDPDAARAWIEDTVRKRPSRPHNFAAFASEWNARFARPVSVLELGSGPGHLAEHILHNCAVQNYVALDFSDAMNRIALERGSRSLRCGRHNAGGPRNAP